jgi:hypothetical protein
MKKESAVLVLPSCVGGSPRPMRSTFRFLGHMGALARSRARPPRAARPSAAPPIAARRLNTSPSRPAPPAPPQRGAPFCAKKR